MWDKVCHWGNVLKGSLTPPRKSVPGAYARVANTPLHMDIVDVHPCYCCLLPQALAQLFVVRTGLQSSLPPQPLVTAHLCSSAQNLCEHGWWHIGGFTLVANHIVYFTCIYSLWGNYCCFTPFHWEILVLCCQKGRFAPRVPLEPDTSTVSSPPCTSLACLYNSPTGQRTKPVHSLPLKPFKSFRTEEGGKEPHRWLLDSHCHKDSPLSP